MKFRGLIVAVVVLVGLCGLLYWSNHRKPQEKNTALSSTATPTILKIDQGSIEQLTLARKASAPVTLAKRSSGQWQIIAPKAIRSDQDAVSGVLSTLSDLNADRVIEDRATDLKQYGLDDPAVTLDIASKGHKEQKLLLGDDTPTGGDVYAMLAGDPRVFAIASYNKTGIDKGVDDLRNKKLFDFGFEVPDKIELHAGVQTWLFTRSGSDWWCNGKKMDGTGVETLAEKLGDLSATGFPDSGFTDPEITITVTSGDGKRTEKVLISKVASNCIAKRQNESELYQLGSAEVAELTSAAKAIKPAAGTAK